MVDRGPRQPVAGRVADLLLVSFLEQLQSTAMVKHGSHLLSCVLAPKARFAC